VGVLISSDYFFEFRVIFYEIVLIKLAHVTWRVTTLAHIASIKREPDLVKEEKNWTKRDNL